MPAYKNKDNGSWYVVTQYTDWTGERKPKLRSFIRLSDILGTVDDAIVEPSITAKPSDTINPFASAPLDVLIKKYGCVSLCLMTVSSIESKTLYPSVFTSNFALLINS